MAKPLTCSDGQGCLCNSCLMRWSGRCACKCRKQGCHGGYVFNQVEACENYTEYTGSTIKECLDGNVSVYQDGYIHCSMIDCIGGCEACYKEFMERRERLEAETPKPTEPAALVAPEAQSNATLETLGWKRWAVKHGNTPGMERKYPGGIKGRIFFGVGTFSVLVIRSKDGLNTFPPEHYDTLAAAATSVDKIVSSLSTAPKICAPMTLDQKLTRERHRQALSQIPNSAEYATLTQEMIDGMDKRLESSSLTPKARRGMEFAKSVLVQGIEANKALRIPAPSQYIQVSMFD